MKSPITTWRNQKRMYRLYGCTCTACKKIYYPKKYVCDCGSQEFEDTKLSGVGKLITFTKVSNPPEAFAGQVPYYLAIVELEEGVKILAQITDVRFDDLRIGMPLKAVFRRLYEHGKDGIIAYGTKFVPPSTGPGNKIT